MISNAHCIWPADWRAAANQFGCFRRMFEIRDDIAWNRAKQVWLDASGPESSNGVER